jgi:hypothetical protein
MANDYDAEKDDKAKELLEKIFFLEEPEPTEPHSWRIWNEGKSNYKPFSLQFKECRDKSDAFLEKCHVCGHEIIMCKIYGGQCHSAKCRHTRIKNMEEF